MAGIAPVGKKRADVAIEFDRLGLCRPRRNAKYRSDYASKREDSPQHSDTNHITTAAGAQSMP
jgi:hypothetical protein